MSTVKRNIVANLLGGGWIAVLTVVITPLQVNILGIEAYGVVGFISTLQIAFTAFDLGLSSTLTRELAADHSPNKDRSTGLLRTSATIYWLSAAAIGIALAALAGQIARRWFNVTEIDVSLLEQSLRVIALYLALRWPVALYSGVLAGFQRMDVLNAVKVATASVRLVGGIAVLLHWRSLYAFLLWTAFNALVEVVAYWLACRWVHPTMPMRPGVSWLAVKKVWRFSASMNALAILAVLIIQLDRLLISKMLTLDALGFYSLAYTAAASISATIAAISSAMLPWFAAAHGQGTVDSLRRRYDSANRFMLFTVGLAASAFAFFGEPILSLWVSPNAAAGATQPLAILAAGFWWSAVVSNAYSVAVATGRPNLVLKVTLVTAAPYAFGLYWLISILGINGAAIAWMLLNISYVVFLLPIVHRSVLDIPVGPWLLRILLPFLLLACVSFVPARFMLGDLLPGSQTASGLIAFVVAVLLYVGLGYLLLGKDIRGAIKLWLRFGGMRLCPWVRNCKVTLDNRSPSKSSDGAQASRRVDS